MYATDNKSPTARYCTHRGWRNALFHPSGKAIMIGDAVTSTRTVRESIYIYHLLLFRSWPTEKVRSGDVQTTRAPPPPPSFKLITLCTTVKEMYTNRTNKYHAPSIQFVNDTLHHPHARMTCRRKPETTETLLVV